MTETNYKQDYVVTWTNEAHSDETQEGFTKESLEGWDGETDIDRIKNGYDDFNRDALQEYKRKIIKIEEITRKTILQVFPK